MKRSLKILHLEDNKNDAELIKETLFQNEIACDITLVNNKDDFLNSLISNQFDIILADYALPSLDGFTTLKLAKKQAPDIPFIFVSGAIGEELAVDTLKQGATDYVIKSRLVRLIPSIERAIREKEEKTKRLLMAREIIELEQLVNELKSTYQQLTRRIRGFIKIELPSFKYSIIDKFLEDLSGYSITQWEETPNFIYTILHPDFKQYYLDSILQLKTSFIPKMLEFKIIRNDGEERWWLQFNLGAFDIEGNLTSISAVIIDNTEDKEAQLKYQNLFQNALIGIYRTDIQTGKILEANTKMAKLFGFDSVEELMKHNAIEFYPDFEVRNELIKKLEQDGFYESYKLQLKRKDGSLFWVSESSKIYHAEGYFEGLLIDITEQKQAEDTLRRDRSIFQWIAEATIHSQTTEELCQTILESLIKTFDFNIGSISLYNPLTQMLDMIASIGIPNEKITHSISIFDERYVGAIVARSREAIFAPNILDNELIWDIKPQIENLVVRANITWPILSANDELIGIFQLISNTPKTILVKDKILFEAIAEMVASALIHKKAEETLRESEERFRAFAEQSLIGVLLLNMRGEFLFFNNEVAKIIDYSNEEISSSIFKNIAKKIFHPDDYNRLKNQITSNLERTIQSSKAEEYQITSKLGKAKWISIHLTPIRITDEIAFGAIVLEITNQKLAQMTLEKERQAFHLLAETSVKAKNVQDFCQQILNGLIEIMKFEFGAFSLYDEKTRMLNPAAVVLKGSENLPELVPMSIDDLSYLNSYVALTKEPIFAPDISKSNIDNKYRERLQTYNSKAIINWPIIDSEDKLLGTIQIIAPQAMEFPEENRFFFEIIIRFFVAAFEKKWLDDALRESQSTFSKLIDTSPTIIIHTDLNGNIYLVNKRALEVLEFSDEKEFLGKNFFDNFSLIDIPKIIADSTSLTKRRLFKNNEYYMIKKTGIEFPVELSASIILNKDQKPDSIIFLGQDITKRKELVESLRRKSHDFETLYKIISLSYQANDLNDFLNFIFDTILDSLSFSGGAILLFDNERSIKVVRALGLPTSFITKLSSLTEESPQFHSLFKTSKVVFLNDFHSLSTKHISLDIKSLITIPFLSKQQIIGSLILTSKEKRKIKIEEKEFLEAIGRNIGTAIAKFIAEDEIKNRQLNLQAFFNIIDDAIMIIDTKTGAILETNESAQEKLGYTGKQLIKMSLYDFQIDKTEFSKHIKNLEKDETMTFLWDFFVHDNRKLTFNVTARMQNYPSHSIIVLIIKDDNHS